MDGQVDKKPFRIINFDKSYHLSLTKFRMNALFLFNYQIQNPNDSLGLTDKHTDIF